MTYNEQGKRTSLENLAGRIATKVAQGKGGLGLRTDMAYTVKHIHKTLLAQRDDVVKELFVQIKECLERAGGK